MSHSNKSGYLELIVGPMFSGKTSKILDIYKQCKFCNIPVCIINHSIDKRYHDTLVSTHDKIMAPCLQTSEINYFWTMDYGFNDPDSDQLQSHKLLRNSEVILINEGQFFPDLYEVVEDMLKFNKKIYICGLDGDFERKKFGCILDLIPLCDKITKLTSLCSKCKDGTPGIFTMRLTNEIQQTVVGSDNYIPVCRKCYKNRIIL
uniref:thymidine kinase n=1 Tax=viral metagenome TaxID=1070528 RepID=A0A6C0EQP2_9ZZZZ